VARLFRTYGKSTLRPPQVVSQPAIYFGPEVELVADGRSKPSQYVNQRAPYSRLQPPAVIGAGKVNPGLRIKLTTPSEVERRRQFLRYQLSPPTVVNAAQTFSGQKVFLAPSHGGKTQSQLSPPTAVFPFIARPIDVTLARITPPPTASDLAAPIVVSVGGNLGWTAISLAPSKRGRPKSHLFPPSVVAVQEAVYGPDVHLTRIRPPKILSGLGDPAVVNAASGPQGGPLVSLAPQSRGRPKSLLRPAVVVAVAEVLYGLSVTLVRIRPLRARWLLRPPVDVIEPFEFGVLRTNLTYSRRGRPFSFLSPPADVRDLIETGVLRTHLAYSRRGKPKSFLRPPVILKTNDPLKVNLTYSRRGKAKSFLKPPIVVFLAVEIYGPEISLTRIRPFPTVSFLRPPTDVSDAQDIGLLRVSLAPSARGEPKSQLRPPAVVGRTYSLGPDTHLAPSSRGRPKSLLKPPTVVTAAFVARAVQIHLTHITPPEVRTLLKPPTVVGEGVAFYGPDVHLTRIRPPKVIHLRGKEFVPFTPPHGDVCGFDIAGSFVCELQAPGSRVSGTESQGSKVTGSSQAGSKVSGSESAGGSVSGSDRKAT